MLSISFFFFGFLGFFFHLEAIFICGESIAKLGGESASHLTLQLDEQVVGKMDSIARHQAMRRHEAWSVRPPALSLSLSLVCLHLPTYDSDYNFTPSPGFVPMAFVALLGFVGLGPPTSQHPMLAFGPRINTFLPLYSASKIHFFIPDCTTCFGQRTCTSFFAVVQTSSHFNFK